MTKFISNTFIMMVVLLCSYNSFGSALELTITPNEVNEMLPMKVNISCHTNVKAVTLMQIQKSVELIATLHPDSSLTYGSGFKSNFMAIGDMSGSAIESYIRVEISSPQEEDAGDYTCVVRATDDDGLATKETAVTSLAVSSVSSLDLESAITYLVDKVTNLETELTMKMSDSGAKLEKQTNDFNKKLWNQKKDYIAKMNRQKRVYVKRLNQQKRDYLNRISKLSSRQIANEKSLGQLKETATHQTAFSYGYSIANTMRQHDTLVFSEEILKIGNDYDPSTGIFTCSRNGLYVFHIMATTYTADDEIQIDLRVNNVVQTSLLATDKDFHSQSSTSSVVALKIGDKVRPVVRHLVGRDILANGDHFAVFSGYLLKLT